MDKRHFTVVEKGGKEHGLYVSLTPSSAAKKAVTKLCASNKSKKVEFYLREITQGSKKKTYGLYLGEMKKLKTPIKLKGRVIYFETIVHLKKVKNTMKGGNFTCAGNTKEIKELCIDDELGLFPDKTECEKSCLNDKLNVELEAWKQLFEWCSVNLPHNRIYCKGGSALGLEVLKSILDLKFIEFTELKNKFNYTEFVTSKNNISENEFVRKKFNEFVEPEYKEFLSFNLIKDWDFTVFMTENQRNDFFIYATQTLGFNKEGKKIFMIRYGNGLKIGDDNLLELSAKIDETLDDLELPLTSLKFEVNSRNIDLFFEIVKMYVKNDIKLERMLEILNELLSYIVVNGTDLVDSIQNGLYTITDPKKISTAGLSNELLRIIDESVGISNRGPNSGLNSSFNRSRNNRESINPLTMKQFLITQFSQPDRLFIRFYGKNVQKSIKIRKFYEKNGIPLPLWLIDETILKEILLKIDRFLDIFNRHIESKIQINNEFFEKPQPVFKIFIDEMDILLQGVNIPNLKLTNIKLEDLNQIEKIIPMNIFEALKKNFLEKEKMKNLEKLTKQFPNENPKIRANQRNIVRKRDLKYVTFLPSGKNMVKPKNSMVKPVYYAFLGTFLAKKSS